MTLPPQPPFLLTLELQSSQPREECEEVVGGYPANFSTRNVSGQRPCQSETCLFCTLFL